MDKGRQGLGSGMHTESVGRGREKRGGHGWLFGLLAGVVFFGIGAARGELAAIWQKAVMICMECIGIG